MASVFKPSYSKPVPTNAEIVTQLGNDGTPKRFARFVERGGKRVTLPIIESPKDKAGNPKPGVWCLAEAEHWYAKYKDADGVWQRAKGFTDKSATHQLASKLEREAEMGRHGIVDPFEKHRKAPLSQHIADFKEHLKNSGDSAKHVGLIDDRVTKVIAWCGFVFLSDITASRVEAFVGDLRANKRSIQTQNHYLSAIKQFCRWLVTDRRIPTSPIGHLKKQNVDTDRRHDRRALTADEFAKLIKAAESGPIVEGVAGRDRAMLYVLSAWTGFRRGELASLTRQSFDLDAQHPTVRVEASYSKHRRNDVIPLHSVVVERLRAYLATKSDLSPKSPLFPLKTAGGDLRRTSKMMRRDLKRAGIPYKDDKGLFADFHSNRHTFISNLGKAGVSLTTAQKLARHSDPKLTANIYTHLGLKEQASAIGELPAPPSLDRGNGSHVQELVQTAAAQSLKLASGGESGAVGGEASEGNNDPHDAERRLLSLRVATGFRWGCVRGRLSSEPRVGGSNPSGRTNNALNYNSLRRFSFVLSVSNLQAIGCASNFARS